jgi:hypothetical protein
MIIEPVAGAFSLRSRRDLRQDSFKFVASSDVDKKNVGPPIMDHTHPEAASTPQASGLLSPVGCLQRFAFTRPCVEPL